jgi:hypothetical protein
MPRQNDNSDTKVGTAAWQSMDAQRKGNRNEHRSILLLNKGRNQQ